MRQVNQCLDLICRSGRHHGVTRQAGNTTWTRSGRTETRPQLRSKMVRSEIQRQLFGYAGPSLAMAIGGGLIGQFLVCENKFGRVAPLVELDRYDSFPAVSRG